MEITIKKLTMRNFKGVRGERVVEFSPSVTKIYGANRTGKTTIADAFRWCMFGKNTEGKQDFGIKTKDTSGNVIPELEHAVSVVLVVDGREVTITRTYTEKWSKPKGVAQKQLTGHTTIYHVDGQLYTQGDFNAYINSLCNESLFMAITSPSYFVSLKPDQQRSMLTEMVGETSPAQVAKGNAQFEALLQVMGEQDMAQFRQHLAYQMKEIKDELKRIPVRISEQQNDIAAITPTEPTDWAKVQGDIQATEAAIKRIEAAIAEAIADSSAAQQSELDKQQAARQQLRQRIAQAQEEAQRIELDIKQTYNTQLNELVAMQNTLSHNVTEAGNAVLKAKADLEAATRGITMVSAQLAQLAEQKRAFVARWNAVNERTLTFDPSQFVCPCCERPLEAEDVEAKKAELVANFNADKARELDAMEMQAQQIKYNQQRLEQQLAQHNQQQQTIADQITQLQHQYDNAVKRYEEKKDAVPMPVHLRLECNKDYKRLTQVEIPNLQAELDQLATQTASAHQTDAQAAVLGLQADQQQLQAKLNALNALAQVGNTITSKQARIAQLEQQEAQLNIQLTELEGQEYTAEQLLQCTIEQLETKVNALFNMVRFTMFDHKINGSLKPACECTVGGVPYSDLNNAGRINAGIDIINAMCKHKGIYAPCFIDNAESINEVMAMHSQRIDLLVSTDKELKVELR